MQQVQKYTARYLDLIFFLPIPYLKMKKIVQLMRDDIKNNNDISQKILRCLIFLIDVHYIMMSHF